MFDSQPTTCTLYGVGTGVGGAASVVAGLFRPDASESESYGQEDTYTYTYFVKYTYLQKEKKKCFSYCLSESQFSSAGGCSVAKCLNHWTGGLEAPPHYVTGIFHFYSGVSAPKSKLLQVTGKHHFQNKATVMCPTSLQLHEDTD